MPHLLLDSIPFQNYPFQVDSFSFEFCAFDIFRNDRGIVLVKYQNISFLLDLVRKDNGFLIKYSNSVRLQSIGLIKQAMLKYAIGNKIIAHNINFSKERKNIISDFYKNINDILDFSSFLAKTNINHDCIFVEIGFGSGRHILNLAKTNPKGIIIGIEVHRPSIEQVLNQIKILGIKNLFIFNCDCRILFDIFPSHCIDRIYLHFPIPWDKNHNRRVVSKYFILICNRILKEGGFLELKTDSQKYYEYSLDLIRDLNLFRIESSNENNEIISKYEQRWLNQNKKILKARFYNSIISKDKKDIIFPIEMRPLSMKKLLESKNFKLHSNNHFFHIKCIYRFNMGYVLFVIFGIYQCPDRAHIVIYDSDRIEIVGEIVPTFANKYALNLLMKTYGVSFENLDNNGTKS